MTGFGWKGGIGTSSRLVEENWGRGTVGILVLTNTGAARDLRFDGIPIGRHLVPDAPLSVDGSVPGSPAGRGSIMIILATDAPLSARQLGRLARRTPFGLARAGGIASHGSGDFCIAFSTGNRISTSGRQSAAPAGFVPEEQLSSLFRAVIDATEEAIVNSLLRAETLIGRDDNQRQGIPLDRVTDLIERYRNAGGAT